MPRMLKRYLVVTLTKTSSTILICTTLRLNRRRPLRELASQLGRIREGLNLFPRRAMGRRQHLLLGKKKSTLRRFAETSHPHRLQRGKLNKPNWKKRGGERALYQRVNIQFVFGYDYSLQYPLYESGSLDC